MKTLILSLSLLATTAVAAEWECGTDAVKFRIHPVAGGLFELGIESNAFDIGRGRSVPETRLPFKFECRFAPNDPQIVSCNALNEPNEPTKCVGNHRVFQLCEGRTLTTFATEQTLSRTVDFQSNDIQMRLTTSNSKIRALLAEHQWNGLKLEGESASYIFNFSSNRNCGWR